MKIKVGGQKNYKLIIIMSVIFFSIVLYQTIQFNSGIHDTENYYKNFNLTFSGIVYDKEFVDRGEGIIRINLATSNVSAYDVRDSLTEYYCIIKNSKAEIFQDPYTLINIGDSVSIIGKERKFKLYKNGILYIEEILPSPTNFNNKSKL